MSRLFLVLGILMIASGLLWAAQGSGLFPYPAQSFMIDSRPWIGWGFLMVLAGGLVLWASRWRSGR
ncbi:hypothetical protein Rumeso_04240 [Rubellimicrobium mesophilum DSM 19309]|uniref:Uncharacterized protein n=1 Tax=Rubellimicrobium mesophilum DSM 19309 TaxID=442562 RepID=A0A017HJ61_9RHOB|nr:hypothetical protein [Rubellimicrobium mesophilum]EYD74183.1 hypothetical protein Rumeso_04240 [Rubellimicrobium mesophilum DSM 19309]